MAFLLNRTHICTLVAIFAAILIIECSAEKEMPITKFGQNVAGPTMIFSYW